jgi:hypothetical protein
MRWPSREVINLDDPRKVGVLGRLKELTPEDLTAILRLAL